MDIIVGKLAGFCFGVKNAVEKTKQELEKNKNEEIYCLGQLVHNSQVVKQLENIGLKVIDDICEIAEPKGKKVIIRAHGAEKKIYEEIKKIQAEEIDLTCPKVLAIHKIVEKYIKQGYYTLYIGEEKHPESKGTISLCNGIVSVIEKKEDIQSAIQKIKDNKFEKVLIIAQTTFSLEKFNDFVKIIQEEIKHICDIQIRNTICDATRLRQEETEEISKKVDSIIIIGGKNSSNTRKLYEISCKNCENVKLIETIEEIKDSLQEYNNCNKIGIMAGASTPQENIEEVKRLLEKL